MERNFQEMLASRWEAVNSLVCVGLDSELSKIPKTSQMSTTERTLWEFNCKIVRATKDLVCAYKPNIAFYEAHGEPGYAALRAALAYIHDVAPEVPVILDAKRADIGNTNNGYIQSAFEYFDADAITVHPYLGAEALKPFLERTGKGIFVLCRTSNPGAGEFQDLTVQIKTSYDTGTMSQYVSLYEYVAHRVANHWNTQNNCGLVVGATYPNELANVRKIVGDMPILIPGIGAQGGDVEATVKAGANSKRQGMIINSSRGIIFASDGPDFAEAARRETIKLRDQINQYR